MEFVSYDGFVFADLDFGGELPIESGANQWRVDTRVAPRVGAPAHLAPGTVTPRDLVVDFVYEGDGDPDGTGLWLIFDQLVGRLDPMNQSPRRKLVARRNDGALVWRYATVSMPMAWSSDDAVNVAQVRFTSADPLWRKMEARTILPAFPLAQVPGTHSAVSLPNAGQAAVHPTYTIDHDGTPREDADKTSSLGWSKRWTKVFTNRRPNTVARWPYLIDLDNTADLVAASDALADGDDLRVLFQGKEIARKLVAWGEVQTYALVVLPRMESGETIELDIVYGNSAAGSPKTLAYPDHPAAQVEWSVQNASSAGTTTIVHAATTAGLTNAVALGGRVLALTGPNAGAMRSITGFSSGGGFTDITTDAFGSAWGSGDRFLVLSSINGRILWNTAITERGNNPARGRWWLSSGESPPDIVRFDVPWSWKPYLYAPGRDKKGQRRFSRLGDWGDVDSFAVVDVSRTWENGPSVPEEGGADGVSLSLPFPITAYRSMYTLVNPSGMCKAVIASRGQGGEQFRELDSATVANLSLDRWDPGTITTPSDTRHLYTGLIPAHGDEIPPDWRSDQGTTTSGGSDDTITDGEKDWVDDQWVGATLRMTGGANKGKSRTVTGNTATQATVDPPFDEQVTDDKSYELRHKPLLATLRDFLECNVDVDLSDLDVSGDPSDVEDVYHVRGRLWIGGGYGDSPARRGEVRVGSVDDWVLITPDEEIRVDSARRTAAVVEAATGEVVRRLVEPTVQWLSIATEDGVTTERRSLDGMPLPIGTNPLANPGADVSADHVALEVSGGVAAAVTTVDTPTAFQSAGMFRLQVTTNPGSGYAQMVWPEVACRESDLVELVAALRTTLAALRPLLAVRWRDEAGAPIGTSVQAAYTPVVDTWLSIGEQFTAPAGATTFEPIVRCSPSTTGAGSVYADVVDPGSPALWYDEHGSAGVRVGATYTEGFLA